MVLRLDRSTVQFVCPDSHREAVATGMKVKVFTGELFCERHSLHLG